MCHPDTKDNIVSNDGKTRLDVETTCPICALVFTIHGIDQMINEEGSGYDIGNLKCPNCEQKGLHFDIQRVADNGFVKHRRKEVHDAKVRRSKS